MPKWFVSLYPRIQDGFLIFRWWKMYNPKQKQHGETAFISPIPPAFHTRRHILWEWDKLIWQQQFVEEMAIVSWHIL